MMREFNNVDDLWLDALGILITTDKEMVSRNGRAREIFGYQTVLTDLDRTFVLNGQRKLSPQYAAAETLWYLSGERTIERIVAYAPQYIRFAEVDVAYGAYGYRWMHDDAFVREGQGKYGSQFFAVKQLLHKMSNSRQAVMAMWNAGDLSHAILADHADLPCTLTWQFILRDNRLHMVCTMRSEDAWLGMPYDIFVNTTMQRLLAGALGCQLGTYVHQVGSLHLYSRNYQQVVAAIAPRVVQDARERSSGRYHSSRGICSTGWQVGGCYWNLETMINNALRIEERVRTEHTELEHFAPLESVLSKSSPLWDLVLLCASAWVPVSCSLLQSSVMEEAYDANR